MRMVAAMTVALAAFFMQGCASTAALEARQLAYTGNGPDPCLFGGATEKASEHCAWVKGGQQAFLAKLNEEALRNLPEGPGSQQCQIHVARLEDKLEAYPDIEHAKLYSCPKNSVSSGICHVSLRVRMQDGNTFVLDNGAVLDPDRYSSSLASLEAYTDAVEGIYWTNQIPEDAREIALARYSEH